MQIINLTMHKLPFLPSLTYNKGKISRISYISFKKICFKKFLTKLIDSL
jgi:hypothetical protein